MERQKDGSYTFKLRGKEYKLIFEGISPKVYLNGVKQMAKPILRDYIKVEKLPIETSRTNNLGEIIEKTTNEYGRSFQKYLCIDTKNEKSVIEKNKNNLKIKNMELKVSLDDNRMLDVFKKLKENFEERFKSISILELGEDSLRYDFFSALMEIHNLKSYQIHLEYPINKDAFESKIHINSKRKENPQMDLFSPKSFNPLIVEFGLFKRNSNIKGGVNPTEKLFKIFNDLIRLVLVKQFIQNGIAYFVCFADQKFLNYQLKGKNSLSVIFPSETYEFDSFQISKWIENYKSAQNSFDIRFVEKIKNKDLKIKSELVFNELLSSDIDDNILESRILIYKITT